MKKYASIIIIFTMLLILAAGCSGSSSVKSANSAPTSTKSQALAASSSPDNIKNQSTSSNTRVTLTITSRSGMTTQEFQQEFGQYLNKKFPNYKFNFIQQRGSNLDTKKMVLAGTPIDIMFESLSHLIDGVIEPGLGFDITQLARKHNVDLNRFDPVSLSAMKAMTGGKLYGLPNEMQVMVLMYNKTIFDKFGIAYPKDGMTWDQTFALAKRLSRRQNGIQYIGLIADTGHVLKLNPFSLPYADPKTGLATFDNSKWATLMNKIFVQESQEPGFTDYLKQHKNKIPGRDEFTKNQNIAMYIFFTDTSPAMDNVNWDMVSAPTLNGYGMQMYPDYVLISKTSQHKDAAMEVLKYLTSDSFQTIQSEEGMASPLLSKSVRDVLGKNYKRKLNWGAVYYDKFPENPARGQYDNIAEKALTKFVPNLIEGTMDVNTVLRQAEETANKNIAAAK